MMRGRTRAFVGTATKLAATCALSGCNRPAEPAGNQATARNEVSANTAAVSEPARRGGIAAIFSRKGPELLSTVTPNSGESARDVKANNGRLTIRQVNGVDTLLVDGKPTRYQQEGERIGATR